MLLKLDMIGCDWAGMGGGEEGAAWKSAKSSSVASLSVPSDRKEVKEEQTIQRNRGRWGGDEG